MRRNAKYVFNSKIFWRSLCGDWIRGEIELDKEGQLESFTGIRVEGDSTRMVTVNAGTIRQWCGGGYWWWDKRRWYWMKAIIEACSQFSKLKFMEIWLLWKDLERTGWICETQRLGVLNKFKVPVILQAWLPAISNSWPVCWAFLLLLLGWLSVQACNYSFSFCVVLSLCFRQSGIARSE